MSQSALKIHSVQMSFKAFCLYAAVSVIVTVVTSLLSGSGWLVALTGLAALAMLVFMDAHFREKSANQDTATSCILTPNQP